MLEEIEKGNVFFTKNGSGVPRIKNFLKDNPGLTPETLWLANEVETNDLAKKHNVALVDDDVEVFETPKPEALIERIIRIATNPGDLVLDCFGGSGTTFSTATKLGRKWIGVELGEHTEEIIISRLKKVISGTDKGGITSSANWKGGGAFKYYHLGPSIIDFLENGTPDFNWSLGKSFLEESFLSSYDYTLVKEVPFINADLFVDAATMPKIGIQYIKGKARVAIVSLNAPDGPQPTIGFDELRGLYNALKKEFSPEYINVFTNRGIEIAYDSKPDDLEVFKVPHAIFSELEK
jgi:adenine-specific DNA-methyltransferase